MPPHRSPRFSASSRQHSDKLTDNNLDKSTQPTGSHLRWTTSSRRATRTRTITRSNIPEAVTSFVGREADLAELQAVVANPGYRCIVLTGAPGCGKSRLALEVGARVASQFTQGVWWVDLAAAKPTQDVAEIVGAVASVGGPALDRPSGGPVLLILDNCEGHAPQVSVTIHRLIGINPYIRILATSSHLLAIPGGRVWPVPPLDTPPAEAARGEERGAAEEAWPVRHLLEYPSVRLFVDRAVAVLPHFTLTEHNALDVARICRRLDGLPHAIELAATRAHILTPAEMSGWLAESLRVLDDSTGNSGAGGHGLWAALDASYQRLTVTEQALFRRLTVFEGGATFEAARVVTSESDDQPVDILNRLLQLVNMSLVMVDQYRAQTRYTLLGILREYGREQLRAMGEVEATYEAHARFYVSLAEQAQTALRSPSSTDCLARLDAERENIEQALHTCLNTQPELGLRLVGALWRYWEARGDYSHARQRLDEMLARTDPTPSRARAHALDGAAVLAHTQGDVQAARLLYAAAQAMRQSLTDVAGEGFSVYCLGRLARDTGESVEAARLFDQSLTLYQLAHDESGLAYTRLHYGILKQAQGDYAEAASLFEESLTSLTRLADQAGVAQALSQQGSLALTQGDYQTAQRRLEEALALQQTLDDVVSAAITLTRLGALHYWQGNVERCIELHKQAQEVFERRGMLPGRARVRWWLSVAAAHQGHIDQAIELCREVFLLYQQVENQAGIAAVLALQARLWLALGNHRAALRVCQQSLTIRRDLPDRRGIALCLETLAMIAAATGRLLVAARLDAAAESLRQTLGAPRAPVEAVELDRHLAQAREMAKDHPGVLTLVRHGAPLADIIAYGLEPDWKTLERPPRESGRNEAPGPASQWLRPDNDAVSYDVRINGLGIPQVFRRDQLLAAADWTYAKPRELLYYLLSYPERTKEQIGVDLWPDASKAQLRTALHSALHRLRRALGGRERVLVEGDNYAFNRSLSYWYDVEVFERHLAEAERLKSHALAQATYHLQTAIALYRGDFLEHGAGGAEWVFLKRERLRQGLLQALLSLGHILFTQHRYDQAVEVYRRAVAEDSYLEAAHRELMRCYARQGERGHVARHYQSLRTMLQGELRAAPAPETTLLYERLMAGEGI